MTAWLVTIKLPAAVGHDGRHKQTGTCPAGPSTCTDRTGAHHTVLVHAADADTAAARAAAVFGHVTRVEEPFVLPDD